MLCGVPADIYARTGQGCTTMPSVHIDTPNGGEKYRIGDTVKIVWNTCNLTVANTVHIILLDSRLTGTYTGEVIDTAPNTGIYIWTIPPRLHTMSINGREVYTIQVSAGFNLGDNSDRPFSIVRRY